MPGLVDRHPVPTSGAPVRPGSTDAGGRAVTSDTDLLMALLVEAHVHTLILTAIASGQASDDPDQLRAQFRDMIGGSYGR